MADTRAIEGLRTRCPNWRIEPYVHEGEPGWRAQPKGEEYRPPWFELEQLQRGLRTSVVAWDPVHLARLIAIQDRLRQEMVAAGERPLSGRTYLEGRS